MKKLVIMFATICSLLTFANEISGPKYKIEGNIGVGFQVQKNENKNEIWQRYNKLQLGFMPEWKYKVNDKLGLSFGPKAILGLQTGIELAKTEKVGEYEAVKGINGLLGGELDLDFNFDDNRLIYLGFDFYTGGETYVDFSKESGKKLKANGLVLTTGITFGGKLNDKVNLGVRAGYEYEKLTIAKGNKDKNYAKNAHNLRLDMVFGYLLGN